MLHPCPLPNQQPLPQLLALLQDPWTLQTLTEPLAAEALLLTPSVNTVVRTIYVLTVVVLDTGAKANTAIIAPPPEIPVPVVPAVPLYEIPKN